MTPEDFYEPFLQLTQAFTVTKGREKGEVYYKKLCSMDAELFIKTCDFAIETLDKFPAISKLLSISQMLRGFTSRVEQECNICDGFGTVSLWKHTFRARCVHGEKVSKYIPLEPYEGQKQRVYKILNTSWKELYGENL